MSDGKGIRNSKFEMRKLEIGRKCSCQARHGRGEHFDIGPLRPTPAQAGMLLRSGWFIR
jgi:hypothetical protein